MATNVQTGTLSLDDIALVPVYQTFQGRYVDAMPALTAEGRIPMSISELMKRRLQVLQSENEELVSAWWVNYFDSPDGVAYKGDEVKVVLNAQMLLDITPGAELNDGALVLTEKQYDGLPGKTFSRKQLEKYRRKIESEAGSMIKNQALENPVWQAVAGSELLEQYADAHFKRYDAETAMGVYLADAQNQPTMRALILGGGYYNWSGLDGYGSLDNGNVRLVGVRQGLEGKIV